MFPRLCRTYDFQCSMSGVLGVGWADEWCCGFAGHVYSRDAFLAFASGSGGGLDHSV